MEIDSEEIDANIETSFNESLNESLQTDNYLQFEKLNCFFLYKKYIKEIYARMKKFKDELLVTCLEFLLSLPKELVVYNLDECFDALKVTYISFMFDKKNITEHFYIVMYLLLDFT
jgi:hypothetical protein